MLYDNSNDFQKRQFLTRATAMAEKGAIVDLTEKKPTRSQSQNKYLHVILGYFAMEMGETLDYVKDKYYKYLCNRDIFVSEKDDKFIGKVRTLRSTADLTTDEMSLSIERFRNWAAGEGVYIPSADEHRLVQQMEVEVSRNKQYML